MIEKILSNKITLSAIGLLIFMVVLLIALWSWYNFKLWSVEYAGRAYEIEKEYNGKAILAEAEHSRMARVEAARAEKEAALLTAEAISIVGKAAKEYPEYRQQEFYMSLGDALKEGKIQQIIYLPTEAGMPITEAGKR